VNNIKTLKPIANGRYSCCLVYQKTLNQQVLPTQHKRQLHLLLSASPSQMADLKKKMMVA